MSFKKCLLSIAFVSGSAWAGEFEVPETSLFVPHRLASHASLKFSDEGFRVSLDGADHAINKINVRGLPDFLTHEIVEGFSKVGFFAINSLGEDYILTANLRLLGGMTPRQKEWGKIGKEIGSHGGSAAGAMVGGAIGGAAGPSGTAIGGLAGGAYGSYAGAHAGQYAGRALGAAFPVSASSFDYSGMPGMMPGGGIAYPGAPMMTSMGMPGVMSYSGASMMPGIGMPGMGGGAGMMPGMWPYPGGPGTR